MHAKLGMKSTLLFLFILFSNTVIASEENWEKAYFEIENQVESAIAGEVLISFSAYDSDENEIPINNLTDVVVKGKVKFISPKGIWRNEKYISKVVENPTWLDIAILANEMILKTQDTHHVFLEDVEYVREEKGIKIYDFIMGS